MKITALKPRRKCLTGIELDTYIDPKELCAETDAAGLIALDSELCDIEHLKAGKEISDEYLVSLIEQSHIKRAKSRAMWYLSRSSYPKAALIKKLSAAFPSYAAEAAADRMEELGFINDADYANRRLQVLMHNKGMSLKMAVYTLGTEGVDREVLSIAAEEAESEYDPAVAVAEIYERKYKNRLHSKKDFDRMIAGFVRKGFSPQFVLRSLREIDGDIEFFDNTEF